MLYEDYVKKGSPIGNKTPLRRQEEAKSPEKPPVKSPEKSPVKSPVRFMDDELS